MPLVSLLGAKSMRERHWTALKTVTKKEFTPPYADKKLLLGGILALRLHEFTGDVEDICDQAAKELKIETTIKNLDERWLGIEWLMESYKDTDVPLLKMAEEDFEALEADQLTVQGMLASRFVKQFEAEAQNVSFFIFLNFKLNVYFGVYFENLNILSRGFISFFCCLFFCSGKNIWPTWLMCSC